MLRFALKKFLWSFLPLCTIAAPSLAADLCNRTGVDIRFTNHYTGAALLFGGVTTFTGWYNLRNGECAYVGANSGQKDIIMVVQKAGRLWGWTTLVPSKYPVETRTVGKNNGDYWRLQPSQSYVCVPDEGSFEDRRDWIPADAVSSARCRNGETLQKQLLFLDSFATSFLPNVSVVLTPNGAYLR